MYSAYTYTRVCIYTFQGTQINRRGIQICSSLLNMRAESTCSKGLEIPCQNTFKDKPAFLKHVKRLIKVLVYS